MKLPEGLRSDFRGTTIAVGPKKEIMQLWSVATENGNYPVGRTSSEIEHILDSHWFVERAKELHGYSPMARSGRCYGGKLFNKHRAISITQFFEYPAESGKA